MHPERYQIRRRHRRGLRPGTAGRAAGWSRSAPRSSGPWRARSSPTATLRSGRGLDHALHPARVPLRRGGCAAHQLPPPSLDAADAGLGLRRPRDGAGRLPGRGRARATASSAMEMRCSSPREWRVELPLRGAPSRRGDRRAHRPDAHRARHGGDAGLHAGGHPGHGQGGGPGRPPGARRGDHPREHLPPDAPPGRGAGAAARRAAPLHGLAAGHPHRLRRLPGLQPGQEPPDHRGGRAPSSPTSTGASTSSPPSGRWRSRRRSAPTSSWPSTSARPRSRERAYLEESLARTTRWLQRCAGAWSRGPGALFGIVQGGARPRAPPSPPRGGLRRRPPRLRARRVLGRRTARRRCTPRSPRWRR